MRVDHRGFKMPVPQQDLDGADIAPRGKQMRGERMPQAVDAGMLADAGKGDRVTKRPLQSRGRGVPAQPLSGLGVNAFHARRKYELPARGTCGRWVLARQGIRHRSIAATPVQGCLVFGQEPHQMLL